MKPRNVSRYFEKTERKQELTTEFKIKNIIINGWKKAEKPKAKNDFLNQKSIK
jgi:hypothetical protein